ncbi:hypothetical protein HMPREF1049_1200 [Fusobacterium necrophorum subsp. funduliforme ATCC 51357]|uniref:Uncharacterized protein n=1 Tax=Fusobacterium necrophorum subsp. funduliforme Fnf 1007 TaxID=1161424 RepID=A0AAN3VW11_9FUSO|nr:hypothetical protein HMPREF1049_1200 [Fusobacterium necrophorum subsp. funduliforme ATCC 51357]EJU17739.1 hypothetical protein HMPREF1127_1949 [Fusobacterium necrophorum subsp. funduliforme Fnf 1007]
MTIVVFYVNLKTKKYKKQKRDFLVFAKKSEDIHIILILK